MRVLVVEDDRVARSLLVGLLKRVATVDETDNVSDAMVAFLTARDDGKPYDLICLDIDLSGEDGTFVLRQVRLSDSEAGGFGPDRGTRVLMTTGCDENRSILDAFRDNADGYLIKPIQPRKLMSELERFGLIESRAD